jgi:hypothetical protein
MSNPYSSELYRKVLDTRPADENVKTVAVDLTLCHQKTHQRRYTHLTRCGHVQHSATAGGTEPSFRSGTRGKDCMVGALFAQNDARH